MDENPRILPLFEINVDKTMESYASPIETTSHDDESGQDALKELRCTGSIRTRNANFATGRRDWTWRNKPGNNGRPTYHLHHQELTSHNTDDNDHALRRIQGPLRLVIGRHERVGSKILSTPDQPRHRRKTGVVPFGVRSLRESGGNHRAYGLGS